MPASYLGCKKKMGNLISYCVFNSFDCKGGIVIGSANVAAFFHVFETKSNRSSSDWMAPMNSIESEGRRYASMLQFKKKNGVSGQGFPDRSVTIPVEKWKLNKLIKNKRNSPFSKLRFFLFDYSLCWKHSMANFSSSIIDKMNEFEN